MALLVSVSVLAAVIFLAPDSDNAQELTGEATGLLEGRADDVRGRLLQKVPRQEKQVL